MQRRDFLRVTSLASLLGIAGCVRTPRASDQRISRVITAADYERERRYLTTTHGRVAYFERGSGPAALFVHGFPLNSFQWRGAIERLQANRRCIAPDLLGMGYTEVAVGRGLEAKHQASMLIELMDRLNIQHFDVIANDSGGAVAQLLLRAAPQRVNSLLLTNCDTEIDCPPPALLPIIELAHAGRFAREWLLPWRRDPDAARGPEGLGGLCYSRPGHPTNEALEYYLAPLVASPEAESRTNAYAIALERNVLAGIATTLKQYRGPVRIVWGMADSIFKAESPHYLDDLFPSSRGVRRLTDAKLFFPEEYPDVIADEALRLWRRCDRDWQA